MKILYIDWNEYTGEDCKAVMKEMGHDVISFLYKWETLSEDLEFEEALLKKLLYHDEKEESFDLVFSFNFFPIVSRV